MGILKDLTGMRFGRLVVVSQAESTPRKLARWNCICDCGGTITPQGNNLRNGRVKSCGCIRKERCVELGKEKTTHGMSTSFEYGVWIGLRTRCNDPDDMHYPDYGGRGIKVCERWQSFDAFLADMGLRPSAKHSIDRIDNGGNYSPENCRWATPEQQAQNKRSNVLIEHNGETLCLEEWGRRYGIRAETISKRLKRGVSGDQLFRPPSRWP